jgi:hypothetical protein
MPTVALTIAAYNDAVVRSALAADRRVTETRQEAPEPAARTYIAGRAEPAPGTRINTGDPRGVSVTPGPPVTRLGGRPRRYTSSAEGNRARQRAYRARRAPQEVRHGAR